ncbi:MAG: alanine--tRNA ligase [Euryarchaeota archaeon]|jgi:alanyl-tRNA synthetase|uniref:alanine--tRNA ligase n=1 Tax=Methanobacterium sp. MZD130B TaxID=3394378 RepID=UPI0039FD5539|nr:alanine--tRNA ligase [Euryarchaeota archaeon]
MITMSVQFKKLGYIKQTCKNCGNDFWSISERETCGDAPCDEYQFIGNPATSQSYDLFSIHDIFIRFFQERGHTPIRRYPVLAKRWRDDVFLVGASIYNFQPWVTSGQVKPPANPLVVAQPSIRLNDVDNVGRTGRHMTCFTMGGHHAFNSENDQIYWDDETVKYCHDFITHLGIDEEEITFIESWWEGGGNSGPCYEVCVRGVELATLVFIQYRTTARGEREEIPLKIVDTGYGLERFAWISQGTPTAYDASFGPVIEELREMAGVELNHTILGENAQVAGMMDIEDIADLKTLRSRVAERLGITLTELKEATEPMEAIYVIADHTRCLAFMLADGVIPSNVKEGYLARLILRRTIRFIKKLGLKESLGTIMNIQLNFLSQTYPEIRNHQEHILHVIELEEKRYHKTIRKGHQMVKKSIKYLKKDKKFEMPLEMLINLYDSQGLPPETVAEIAGKLDFKVKVPDNFYTLVAAKHSEEIVEEKIPVKLDYPETELLFYDDPHKTEFNSRILGFYENHIILDKTLFYPEGGGQPSDIGFLDVAGEKLKVSHAEKLDGIVLHRVNQEKLDKIKHRTGSTIKGNIDWNRRISLARNHTATHLLVAAARMVLGDHIWQAGAQKGVKKSRIDLSHYQRINQEELENIELMANRWVMENIPVTTEWMDRTEAEKKYGFTLYQGGVVPGKSIRVIQIPGVDVQACAGTHCDQTGQIGLIKVNRTERIQDGVERLEFSAGESAVEYMQITDALLNESAAVYKVEANQLPKTSERFFTEWKAFKNEIGRLKAQIANIKTESLIEQTESINSLKFLADEVDADISELVKIVTKLTDDGGIDVVFLGNSEGKIAGAGSPEAVAQGVKINEIVKEAAKIMGGGGGGKPHLAQGAGKEGEKLQEALEFVRESIKDVLAQKSLNGFG